MDDKKLHSGADFTDYDTGQKSPEEIGYPFLRGAQSLPEEAIHFDDTTISKFEEKNGLPYAAVKLGYGDKFSLDPQVEMKVRAIDEHIRQTMQQEGLKDTPFSYQTILARMAGKLADSIEGARNHNQIKGLLDNLFMQVAFANGKSSKTFLQEFSKRFSQSRVDKLLVQLGAELQKIIK